MTEGPRSDQPYEPLAAQLPAEPDADDHWRGIFRAFDTALRGYDRGQVDRYVSQVDTSFEALRAEATAAWTQLEAAQDEIRRLRAEVDHGRPGAEAIGNRVAQIIALAESEAEQTIAEARRLAAEMTQERDRVVEEARAHADGLVADARRHVVQIAEAARKDLDALGARRTELLGELRRAHHRLGQAINEASGPSETTGARETTSPTETAGARETTGPTETTDAIQPIDTTSPAQAGGHASADGVASGAPTDRTGDQGAVIDLDEQRPAEAAGRPSVWD